MQNELTQTLCNNDGENLANLFADDGSLLVNIWKNP